MADDNKLDILIDVRSRLDDLVKAQNELRKLGKEANSAGQALKEGFGIDIVHRGIELLKETLKESVIESMHMADAIKDGAKNLTLSNEAYQVLSNVLRDAGGEAGLLTMMISQNDRSLVEARNSASAAAAAYRTLGLDIVQLESLPKEKRMELYGRAVLNAKDQTLAFSAASQILGTRNLPIVLGALKDLARDGYDVLSEAQKRAMRVMGDETIERLEKAQKNLEKLKQAWVISTGEIVGSATKIGEGIRKAWADLPTLLTLAALSPKNAGHILGILADDLKNEPKGKKEEMGGDGAAAAKQIQLANIRALAEKNLKDVILDRQTLDANPNQDDISKKKQRLLLIQQEILARKELIAAIADMPLASGETQLTRDYQIKQLQEQNIQLGDQLVYLKQMGRVDNALTDFFSDLDKKSAYRDSELKFRTFNDPRSNPDYLTVGQGAKAGAMDWVSNLGSQGEQVAQTLQSTLGATVDGISDGIYGWVTGTQSFGQTLMQLGGTILKSILHTIIQLGVQMLVNAVIGRTIQAASIAANIATASGTAVALSAIWAVPATLATIASFGGAAVAAPAEIAMANAITLGAGGFKVGGYTGDGPEDEIAGYVHGREGVLNAPAMKFLGRGFLNAMNKGDYASAANAAPAFAGAGGSGGRESGRNTHIYLDRSAWLDAVANDLTGIAHEVFDQRARA